MSKEVSGSASRGAARASRALDPPTSSSPPEGKRLRSLLLSTAGARFPTLAAGHATDTFVAQLMRSKVAVELLSAAPIPLSLVRPILARDNARENQKDSWQRLRVRNEAARYRAVRTVTERYAREGFVLDIGCSQGILQEGLRYGRYLGVDNYEESIRLAQPKCDRLTQFVCADGSSFVADLPPDAVVINEVLYYLPDPVAVVEHHARQLAPGGVVIISIYARTWSSRRLLRDIGARLELLESNVIRSGHLAWTVAAYRPFRAPSGVRS